MKTKVLVIGAGGREHALVWKLRQSECIIYCAPGNAGISNIAQCVPIKVDDIFGLREFAQRNKIDLTIVGPEVPLGLGIVNEFTKSGLKIFGPNQRAAQLETSKAFAKQFCRKYNLPIPEFEVFTSSASAQKYIAQKNFPLVIKVDGLAAGKGAIITKNKNDALSVIERILDKKAFGLAGEKIVIEDYIYGQEVSMLAITDADTIIPLIPARDHKPLLNGNKGPNTGGMGSYAPIPELSQDWLNKFKTQLFAPLLSALKKESIEYKGIIYAGLILSGENFYILEFNCRWGDPEAEVLLPLLKNDLIELCFQTIEGTLKTLDWKKMFGLTVIAASAGYPEHYEKGKLITGVLQDKEDVFIFHCGTKKEDNRYYTNGGRVLAVTGIGKTLSEAREKSYRALKNIWFDGIYYRTDIGKMV
ncbi:MAG: phosphoribosylamine--glycine ligase [candidate division WOR-3 bacterium]|nr:phosphoribosylamine--glycine ligase [candidate division WOR-3 bacterium]